MSDEYPHVPAAFINNIADEGSKREAVEWLQKTWNEACALRAQRDELLKALTIARRYVAAASPAALSSELEQIDAALRKARGGK